MRLPREPLAVGWSRLPVPHRRTFASAFPAILFGTGFAHRI
ncbi:MAG: OapA N-terminal domain-containing protein [Planctomycetia bacterium]